VEKSAGLLLLMEKAASAKALHGGNALPNLKVRRFSKNDEL